jgi:hypothetical protein
MKSILLFVERSFNTLRYNGFYIFLSLLFPYIIWKFDAGKEIIVSMTEQEFSLNIALSLVTFSASCLSIWCIPTLAIRFFQFVTGDKDKTKNAVHKEEIRNCLYQQLINVYNGKRLNTKGCKINDEFYKSQLPIRYFAVAPWGLFVLSCIQVFQSNAIMVGGLLLLIALIILIDRFKLKLVSFYEFLLGGSKKQYIVETFVVRYKLLGLLFLGFIVLLFFSLKGAETHQLKWFLILLNFFFLLVFYSFLLYLENSKLEQYVSRDKSNKAQSAPASKLNLPYRISNINYRILLVYLIAAIVVFYFLNQTQLIEYLSPVVIIVTMATALIIFFEFFFTSQLLLIYIVKETVCEVPECSLSIYRDRPGELMPFLLKIYRFVLLVIILVVVNLYFFSSSNSHRIRKEVAKTGAFIPELLRPTLTGYFNDWYKNRNITGNDSVVYLISGQGGGSRAAAWFFMNMSELDSKDSNFFKKVFSISTVSGSSTGANMFLASRFKGFRLSGNNIKEKVTGLYGRNYMSSCFFGVMLGDFIESIFDAGDEFPRDRNYHLQKEELAAFEQTFDTTANDFFENDFMWQYTIPDQHWPLFFLNTTVVNFGTRAVFSPVKMNDFSIARDLYLEFKKSTCNDGDNIPLVTCVNQSQAFPILSAYNYMDCIGRLGDGGISENSGCATTLEIYKQLRRYCDSNNLSNVKFVCLNITNGSLTENFKVEYSKASIFNTLSAAINSPFDGSETYAYKNLTREINYMNKGDIVIDCSLDSSITLTRTMSKKAVEGMYNIMKVKKFALPK